MSAVLIQAEERRDLRRSYGKQLRNSGKIPAVVYGKEAGSTPIAVEEKDLMTVLKTDPNAVIQMNIPDIGNMPVMIHEIQRDMLKGHLLAR